MTQPKSRADTGLDHTISSVVLGPTPQNPAPMSLQGQVDDARVRALADQIVRVFLNSLPSNYVSTVGGPHYVRQFQAAAEELARVQILATDAFEDTDYDFTRPESLFQILGTLVFPNAATRGLPEIEGDITFREFLKSMVVLLLRGSKATSLVDGLDLLTDAAITLRERVRFVGQPGVSWSDALDQFTFDIEVARHRVTAPTETMSVARHSHTVTVDADGEGTTTGTSYSSGSGPDHTHEILGFVVQPAHGLGQGTHGHDLLSDFPDLPVALQRNVALVMAALDPAHSLYTYRHLFRESLQNRITDEMVQFDLSTYRYDDLRRDCEGFRSFDSTGNVLSGRYLFSDPTVSFQGIRVGAPLTLTASGPNRGVYEVAEVLTFPFGDDTTTAYPYTTVPTALTGTAVIQGGAIVDPDQNFGLCVAGERLTITSGPNAGTYLLERLLGATGGLVGTAGPATTVVPAPSILRVTRRFPALRSGLAYTIEVDRLGSQVIQVVEDEDVSVQFLSPGGPFDTIVTAQGPLTGRDGRPAIPADVVVEVDGVAVAVDAINPFSGEITLAVPLAGALPGARVVTVSYRWLRNLVASMVLGNPGLGLNRFATRGGLSVVSSSSSGLPGGVASTSRFSLGVVLGAPVRRTPPVRIAHRYIGFEDAYTSALGNPRTLRLGQPPGLVTVPYARAAIEPVRASYQAVEVPSSPWTQVGTGTSAVVDGAYTLEPEAESAFYWGQDFPLPTASVVAVGARVVVSSEGTMDGVFTGVGLGFHDNHRLYFAGALVVENPVTNTSLRHLGILARPGDLGELSSWVVGPSATATVQGRPGTNILTLPLASLPTLLAEGDQFQVLTGDQAGVYRITDLYRNEATSTATFVVTPAFPADPGLAGNRDIQVLFEVRWDQGPCTWRLYADTRTQALQVVFGGSSGGSMTVGSTPLATPASLGPDILPAGYGRILWGNISRQARTTSSWGFLRGESTPESLEPAVREVLLDTVLTGTEDPEKDSAWYGLTPFGDARSAIGRVRITGTPAVEALGTLYGYGYTSPFLNGKRVTTLEARVKVQRDTEGQGAGVLSIRDTRREARLSNILYQEQGGSRTIFRDTTISLLGSVPYSQQEGWVAVGTPEILANGRNMIVRGQRSWTVHNPEFVSGFVEFRVAVLDYTVGAGNRIGFAVATSFGGKNVIFDFVSPNLVALRTDLVTSPVQTYTIPWTDGAARTYRVEYDNSAIISLYVNNVLCFTTLQSGFGSTSFEGTGILVRPTAGSAFTVALDSLSCGPTLDGVTGLGRTFGLWLGGDPTDLNNWVIPRSDGTGAPNTDATQAVPVEMDWRTECWVRVFMDPTYGASFIRPDLDPPPGYTGDFATQSMNPSAGWAVVEYARLPRLESTETFGSVAFGNLNPSSSGISFWGDIRHRVFSNTSTDYRAPIRMTLGRQNVITSGDFLKDKTPEEVLVAAETRTRVSLRPCGINADRVFQVLVDGDPLDHGTWSFNQAEQVIILGTPLPSVGYPVGVTFAAGLPVTARYLQTQAWSESQTILNEGTPPVPRGQVGSGTITTISGSGGPDPAFPPAGPGDANYFLEDPYLSRAFVNPAANVMFQQMTFFEVDDGGSRGNLAMLCDNGGPVSFALSGSLFEEHVGSVEAMPPGSWPSVLYASGGSPLAVGILGPATYQTPFTVPDGVATGTVPSMTYPTGPSEGVVPGSDVSSPYRQTLMVMEILPSAPFVQDTVPAPSDQDYASMGPALTSPTVVGLSTGSAWYEILTAADFTRPGPWTGYEEDLAASSLLYGASTLQPTGIPSSGTGFIPLGGSPLPDGPVPVVGVL